MISSKRPILTQSRKSGTSKGDDRQISKRRVPNTAAAVRWSGESKIASPDVVEPRRLEVATIGNVVRPPVCYCCHRDVMHAIHKSTWWRIVTICASILMIFFQPVVDIFDTNNGQPYITAVYYIITIIIISDVALKVSFDAEYFLWYCSCCKGTSCGSKQGTGCCCRNHSAPTEDSLPQRHHNEICSFGSLFFWLDILALAAFIANFALLYTVETSAVEIYINYDLYRLSGEVTYPYFGVEVSFRVFLLIGRSAILARFFQASTVDGFMRFMNLFRIRIASICGCVTSICPKLGSSVPNRRSIAARTLYAFDSKSKLKRSNSFLLRSSAAITIQRKWRSLSRPSVNRSDLPSSSAAKFRISNTSTYFKSYAGRRSKLLEITEGSRVGASLREMTAKNVAIFMMITFFLTYIFSTTSVQLKGNATEERTMIALHDQTQSANPLFNAKAVEVARNTSIPYLYNYTFGDGTTITFDMGYDVSNLRSKDFVVINVSSTTSSTQAYFIIEKYNDWESYYQIILLACVILIWLWGVVGLVTPVMTLVVVPIERMIRLLSMLTQDPLGYQMSKDYKKFAEEEDDVVNSSWWEKDVLEGMETSFLQKTILRIGSLMRVGFGSAGVEIIRQYLLKGSSTSKLTLNQSGSTVNCVFLFCDIRGFTDATEALQEEVFVFTNKIAYVVHSIVHSKGGSANKNIGDAFLVSWRLKGDSDDSYADSETTDEADKALCAVIKIRLALQNDSYFLETIDATAKKRLMEKVGAQNGPVVKMGFGLHAGKAVQGAIGSQRKIDATYISEAVERSETLESLTKRYGLSVLMSDSFYNILSPDVRRRCRMIDRVKLIRDYEEDENYCTDATADTMTLYTYDFIIGVPKPPAKKKQGEGSSTNLRQSRRLSLFSSSKLVADSTEVAVASLDPALVSASNEKEEFKLDLSPYNPSVWTSAEMRNMRMLYTDGIFHPTFQSALEAYFNGDWADAEMKFSSIVNRMSDGPSSYFLSVIKANAGRPHPGFDGYGDV